MYILEKNCWLYFSSLELKYNPYTNQPTNQPLFGWLLNPLFIVQLFSRINALAKSLVKKK